MSGLTHRGTNNNGNSANDVSGHHVTSIDMNGSSIGMGTMNTASSTAFNNNNTFNHSLKSQRNGNSNGNGNGGGRKASSAVSSLFSGCWLRLSTPKDRQMVIIVIAFGLLFITFNVVINIRHRSRQGPLYGEPDDAHGTVGADTHPTSSAADPDLNAQHPSHNTIFQQQSKNSRVTDSVGSRENEQQEQIQNNVVDDNERKKARELPQYIQELERQYYEGRKRDAEISNNAKKFIYPKPSIPGYAEVKQDGMTPPPASNHQSRQQVGSESESASTGPSPLIPMSSSSVADDKEDIRAQLSALKQEILNLHAQGEHEQLLSKLRQLEENNRMLERLLDVTQQGTNSYRHDNDNIYSEGDGEDGLIRGLAVIELTNRRSLSFLFLAIVIKIIILMLLYHCLYSICGLYRGQLHSAVMDVISFCLCFFCILSILISIKLRTAP